MTQKVVAYIDEASCIGCTKCIDACPTDAIIGANRMMHTVIKNDCTGCQLCIKPCPVDCITLIPAPETTSDTAHYRHLHQRRKARLLALDQLAKIKHDTLKQPLVADKKSNLDDKKAFIAQAMARAQANKRPNV